MSQFQVDKFYEALRTSQVQIGNQLVYSNVTGSTMDDARRLAHTVQNHPHGTVLLSERQTKARGARDHKWDASNTGNIYASFILHLPPHFKTFEGRFDLEVAACLAVVKVMHLYGVTGAIPKWPNDVWIKGHKLAGFLVEDGKFDVPGSTKCLIILGMGINVNADVRRNPELHSIATSMMCERAGNHVNREEFFASVCSALEETLARPRQENLKIFKELNLFQMDSEICVTCPSEGKVIDGKFMEVCDNWEIKFLDKHTKEVRQGRSDFFTIRPRVVNKILVVFTGIHGNQLANHLSGWLVSVVDTSKYVVCLVPESSITNSDHWMKTCSLMVLVEPLCDSDRMSSRIRSLLRLGGCVMGAGVASLFLARLMDVQAREVLLESSAMNPELSLLYLQLEKQADKDLTPTLAEQSTNVSAALPEDQARTESESLMFPTTPVCFKFFSDEELPLSCKDDQEVSKADVGSGDGVILDRNSSNSCNDTVTLKNAQIIAYYQHSKERNKVAIFTATLPGKGRLVLWGFDIGVVYPGKLGTMGLGVKGESTDEMRSVEADRFRRDSLLIHVLNFVLI